MSFVPRYDPDCPVDGMGLTAATAPTHATICGIRYSADSYGRAVRRELHGMGETAPAGAVADAARWGLAHQVRPYRLAALLVLGDRPR